MTPEQLQAIRERVKALAQDAVYLNDPTQADITNAFYDRIDLFDEVERLEAVVAEQTKVGEQMAEAGKAALHDLETTDGLYATDGFGAYGKAQQDGCDSNGAWDSFVDQTFKLKHPSIQALRNALAAYEARKAAHP